VGDIESLSMNFFEDGRRKQNRIQELSFLDGAQSRNRPFQVSVKMTNDAKLEKGIIW